MGKNKNSNKSLLPFVSVCTPTFNRRPFIPYMIKCFLHQTYPKDRIEWIIIDDGTDPIKDLVENIPQVKYFYYEEKMLLGKKRNLMHTKCKGEIIIYMDDDDYYPEERISHAVDILTKNPNFLIAGSSEMHIYFDSKNCLYQCGPYKQNHSTAATFAFKKELLNITKYDDQNGLAEERNFLKGYTIPLIQLNTLKSILVFSHKHNSLNKEKLLENCEATKTVLSRYNVDHFIKDPELKQFYMKDMNSVLENYLPGRPENKPELNKQIIKMEEERNKRINNQKKMLETQQKIIDNMNKPIIKEIEELRREYEDKMSEKNCLINDLLKKIKMLTEELKIYKK
uniref:Glycosyltransferase 2-like domain-containing protein n=1 Tax=viral metagenome TaxID=1070528 RepID=A0A6C0KQL3_9ZZZZ